MAPLFSFIALIDPMESGARGSFSAVGRAESDSPWLPALPSTASEAPFLGQHCHRSASAETRSLKLPKGPKKRARTIMTHIQIDLPPTTASPQTPGGSTKSQAIAMALQGQQTPYRRLPNRALPGACDGFSEPATCISAVSSRPGADRHRAAPTRRQKLETSKRQSKQQTRL